MINNIEEDFAHVEAEVEKLTAGFNYSLDVDESLDQIIEIAKVAWESDPDLEDKVRPRDDRLAVNLLRHHRTNYTYYLDKVEACINMLEVDGYGPLYNDDGEIIEGLESGFDGLRNEAAQTIRERVHEAIISQYPELRQAAIDLRFSTTIIVHGQKYKLGPRFSF